MLFAGERNAAIDDQPLPPPSRRRSRRSRNSSRSRRCRRAARTQARGRPSVGFAPPRGIAHWPAGQAETLRRQRSPARSRRQAAATAGRARRAPRRGRTISRSGSLHPHVAADAGAARDPVGADIGKSGAAAPLAKPPQHGRGQCFEQIRSRDIGAGGFQVGHRIRRRRRMISAIDADADGDGQRVGGPLAFDQNAGKLGAAAENVVRPFQRERRAVMPARARRWRRAARARRRTIIPARIRTAPDRSASSVA